MTAPARRQGRPPKWPAQSLETAQAMLDQGCERTAVAERFGVTRKAIERLIARGKLVQKKYCLRGDSSAQQQIPRECLACGRAFLADTKYIRSCQPCRDHGSPLADWAMGGG